MNEPRRAVTLKLDLQADDRASVVRALENIALQIERGEMTIGCSGGYDSGYTYEYRETSGPSHDEYVRQLQQWIAERRTQPQSSAHDAAHSEKV